MPTMAVTNMTGTPNGTNWFENFIDGLADAEDINSVADDIRDVYIWILFAIGVPGNILALITILTLRNINPVTLLIALLAVLDCSALIAKVIGHQVMRNQIQIGTVGCRLTFMTIFLSTTANWILVLICMERYKNVCYPIKKMWIFTRKGTFVVATIVILVFLIFFGTISGVMRVSVQQGRKCGVYPEYIWFWQNVWYWINASLHLFIPFLIIAPLTGLMVWKIYRNSGDTETLKRRQASDTENVEDEQRVGRELTVMLILAAVFFLVLSLPGAVYYLSYSESSDILVRARWYLFEQIQYVCVDSTHAINFFLYFLSAKLLRRHLFELLMCKKCRKYQFESSEEITGSAQS